MSDIEPPQGLELRKQRRGIYLLPNLFTTAALFAGFFAIVQAMNQKYTLAAISIFIAMVLDGIDGRVARMTHTQSAFGAEYDSLSDMVSFGAAPALVIYEWALRDLGRWGWIASFLYCACAALRLARFNTQLDVADKRYFTGLPSPSAAALLAGFVWIMDDYEVIGRNIDWLVWGVTVFAALSMVSNVKFYSFKDLNLRRSVPFWAMLVIVMIFVVITIDQARVLFGIFLAYSLSGYVMWAMQRLGGKRQATPFDETSNSEKPPDEH
jgi:CDP-diacylglycerol---serine O-phosphatidyltransferase